MRKATRKQGEKHVPTDPQVNMGILKQSFHEPAVMPAYVVEPPEIARLHQQPPTALNGVIQCLRRDRLGFGLVVVAVADTDVGELQVAGQHRVPREGAQGAIEEEQSPVKILGGGFVVRPYGAHLHGAAGKGPTRHFCVWFVASPTKISGTCWGRHPSA